LETSNNREETNFLLEKLMGKVISHCAIVEVLQLFNFPLNKIERIFEIPQENVPNEED
jgi:hypothetical protein